MCHLQVVFRPHLILIYLVGLQINLLLVNRICFQIQEDTEEIKVKIRLDKTLRVLNKNTNVSVE